jgi:tRNA-specific 2-thiouridylase
MSGGVDSSVAAHLLLRAGHEVIGVFMRHGEASPAACSIDAPPLLPIVPSRPDHKQGCCSASDAEDARRVADRLSIPFYALDLQAEFQEIIDYFVDEYTRGRTPNPCVQCNHRLKFGKLFEYAEGVGAEFVATGHYARLVPGDDGPQLWRGVANEKDQSYALFGIGRRWLERMLLPVGEYHKPEIRALAAEIGLRVADKKDSQEICFVPTGRHDEFVRARRGPEIQLGGEIVTTTGEVVGTHPGIEGFTIGQRRGLGVAMGERWFVVRIEPETQRVVIGPRDALARSELTASGANWLCVEPSTAFRCLAKIRYNGQATPALAEPLGDRRLKVTFDEPRSGVAPGQAVVCYDGDRVLAGGWID